LICKSPDGLNPAGLLLYAEKLAKLAEGLKFLYVYFNNDAGGYAVSNTLKLREMFKGTKVFL